MSEAPLRVGFDAKRAFRNGSGLGSYSRTLLGGLLRYAPGIEPHLFAPRISGSPWTAELAPMAAHGPGWLPGALWRRWGIAADAQKAGIRLYHGLSAELPARWPAQIPALVTLHDLIFLRFPELYRPADRLIYAWKTREACLRASRVLAISESARADLLGFLPGLPPERVQVLRQAIAERFFTPPSEAERKALRQRYSLPSELILYVGSLAPRKNLALLARAWAALPGSLRPPLVLAGRGDLQPVAAAAGACRSQLIHLSGVSDAELPALYASASLFAYPSLFEGWGLPIVEALAAGLPVLASPRGAMPEAGGPAARYADPERAEDWAEQMAYMLSDSHLREAQRASGSAWAAQFHPRQVTEALVAHYRSLISC
jgi:glycosyltransferase involved in cell wall biosynthesis